MTKAILAFALFAVTQAASATTFNCRSFDVISGWNGNDTKAYLTLTFTADSNTEISGAEIEGAYGSDVADLTADSKWNPKAAKYKDTNRFRTLEDAWHYFDLLLPKDVANKTARFKAWVQVYGEEGDFQKTVDMFCWQ